MLGKPKYSYGQKVKFTIKDKVLVGTVEIIDAFGTFEYSDDVSYDIMVQESPHFNGDPCLYKHIIESEVSKAD